MLSGMTKGEPWSEAIYLLGVNFLVQGKYEKALTIFQGLMALDQSDYKATLAYGESLILLGRAEEALNHFLTHAKMFEVENGMVLGAARASIMLGKLKEAATLIEPVIKALTSPESHSIAKLISDNSLNPKKPYCPTFSES